ncbi:MAG: hypothetical protein WAL56_17620 [Candidatus Sulfotelmatobacter sp.]
MTMPPPSSPNIPPAVASESAAPDNSSKVHESVSSASPTEPGSREVRSDMESVAASPTAPATAAPSQFVQLKEYCDSLGLKCTIEVDPDYVAIELKNGRTTRPVFIGSEEVAAKLLSYPLNDITFLGDYVAVCSYKEHWIEAAVRPLGSGSRNFVSRRAIFGTAAVRSEQQAEIEIPGPGGLSLRLTEKTGILSALDYFLPIYLRIEGIGIAQHDQATRLLEDLSNSLFMQIDFRFDAALALVTDRAQSRRIFRSRGKLDEDNQLAYPRFSYDKSPSSLYWYARSATSMPLLQFLAFYQCIEFFFPQFSRTETISRIKNVLKNPAFDWTKDADINTVVNATLDSRRGLLLDERRQLGATLRQCVDAVALRDFLHETEERKKFYDSGYKKISEKRVVPADENNLVEQTAERIYDVRCKVVHTKNLDAGEISEMILPFSEESELMTEDVALVKFLARKVLIASSSPLQS